MTAQIKPVQDKTKETAVRWINARISVYRYLIINNNASVLVYHSLFVCLHLIMYTHCRSRNCSPFRNPWGHPQYLVRFVLLDLFSIWMFCTTLFVNNYSLINIIKRRHQMYNLTSIHTCYDNYELIDVIIIKKNVDIKVSPYVS